MQDYNEIDLLKAGWIRAAAKAEGMYVPGPEMRPRKWTTTRDEILKAFDQFSHDLKLKEAWLRNFEPVDDVD